VAGPYTREKIENWVSDFCTSDEIARFSGTLREAAPQVLTTFLLTACDVREVEPDEIEEADVREALVGKIARLDLPEAARREIPALCGAFLADLEQVGRLGGGRLLGAYVRALTDSFQEKATGKAKPITRPGSKLGRNDPCPCGSGKKYKKCCMKE
jgi:hypothetical protein